MISIRDFALGSVSGFRRGPGSLIRWQQQAEPHGLVCEWLKAGHATTSSCLDICERGDLHHFLRGFSKKPKMSKPRPRKLSFPSRIPKKNKKNKDLRQMPPVPRQMPDVAAISLRSLVFLVFLGIFEGSDRFLGRGFDLFGFFGNPRTENARSLLFRRFPSKL